MMFVSCVRALCSESAELWAQRKLPEAHERETVDEARARWLALTLRPKDTFGGLMVHAISPCPWRGHFSWVFERASQSESDGKHEDKQGCDDLKILNRA